MSQGYNSVADGSIFTRLAVVGSQIQICEIMREFELMVGQCHPRSSILVSLESAFDFSISHQ